MNITPPVGDSCRPLLRIRRVSARRCHSPKPPSIIAYVDKSGRSLWMLVFILLALWHSSTSSRAGPRLQLASCAQWFLDALTPHLFLKSMESLGSLNRGTPLPRHLWYRGYWAGLILVLLVLTALLCITFRPLVGRRPTLVDSRLPFSRRTSLSRREQVRCRVVLYRRGCMGEDQPAAGALHLDVSRFLTIHSA